jgi:hypothetical protein
MTLDEATAIVTHIKRAVISPQARTIREVFSALAWLDGYRIEERSRQALDAIDLAVLAAGRLDDTELLHVVTMEVFYGGLYEYLEEKSADIEMSVEHDVPTWIEANAPMVASANLRTMEAALPSDDAQAYRTLIEFHGLIDFADYAAEQNRVLQDTWVGIEAKIQAYLAGAGVD